MQTITARVNSGNGGSGGGPTPSKPSGSRKPWRRGGSGKGDDSKGKAAIVAVVVLAAIATGATLASRGNDSSADQVSVPQKSMDGLESTSDDFEMSAAETMAASAPLGAPTDAMTGDFVGEAERSDSDIAVSTALAPAPPPPGGGAGGGSVVPIPSALQGRMVIRNGFVDLEVKNAAETAAKAESLIKARGGFLAEQQANYASGSDVVLVFRIPVASFDDVMRGFAGLGKVISANVSSNEVTGQVVDLEARLKSKRAAADRLRVLLTQATKPGDILAIESELVNREADIEAMQAQLNGFKDQVALSTVRVHLFTPGAVRPVEPEPRQGFASGWRRGTEAFSSSMAALAAITGAILPFLPLALLAVGAYMLMRRRVRRTEVQPVITTPIVAAAAATVIAEVVDEAEPAKVSVD